MYAIINQQQVRKKVIASYKASSIKQQIVSIKKASISKSGPITEELEGSIAFQISKRIRSLMSPMQMELIRPKKYKIKIMANIMVNTPSKEIKRAQNQSNQSS